MQAPLPGEEGTAPSHDMAVQEVAGMPNEHTEQQSSQLEPTFEERFEQFYLQLSEGKTGGMVACVDEMQRIVESTHHRQGATGFSPQESSSPASPPAAVYDEMLQDCRRKAGEATLDRLRKLCQTLSRPTGDRDDDDAAGEGAAMGEEETVIVSYHAALLGKAEGAANIYGGFLRNRLKQANDAAVKKLSSVRALYRLTLASGGGDMTGAAGVSSGSRGGGRGDAEDGSEGGAAAAAADP
ncbi:unnamed protein product, partial [Scytosiphon promiscuus]